MNKIDEQYHNYLNTRSFLGKFYRKFVLYPRINKYLIGNAVDIGCGIGDFLFYRKSTTGIDINSFNVDFCKKNGMDAKLIVNGKYPFNDESIDSAILDNVIEHIDDPASTLMESSRILKKSGLLIIGIPGNKGYKADPDHKIFYTEENLTKLLSSYNFSLKKVFYSFFFKSEKLSDKINSYCIYCVFEKN